jgi:uncharacterized protein (TIGR02996 family)
MAQTTRYEFNEGTSSKFWEITLSGSSFTTRWGRIGTRGQEKTQSFSTPAEAKQEYKKLIASKVKKGYVLAGESPQSAPLAGNPELEAAILNDPDNVEAWLVYGDWLQAQGDPRGELMALQHAASQATGAEATRLKRKASAFLEKNLEDLLGDLAEAVEEEELRVHWHLGFIHSARLARGDDDSEFDVPEAVHTLFALPAARFLREFSLGLVDFDLESDIVSLGAATDALEETGGSPLLESLFIGDFEYPDDSDISRVEAGFQGDLGRLFPRLRSLRVRGGHIYLPAKINLPRLREFTAETGGLSFKTLQSILNAHWPELERLELWFGHEYYGAECRADNLRPLLGGKSLSHLKHLGLRNAGFTNDLCKLLPKAKILPQLQSLDLSLGTLTDSGAEVLAAHAAPFKHLKRIDLSNNLLTREGVKQVAGLCAEVITSNQREYMLEGMDEGDEDPDEYGTNGGALARYVAVGE